MQPTPIHFCDESPVSRRFREVGAIVVRLAIVWFISAMLMALVASAEEPGRVAPLVRIEDARHFISAMFAQVLTAVDRERDAIRRNPGRAYSIVNDIVGQHVDIDRISRLVLGKYWRTATRAQRERFKSAFLKKLIQTYVTALSEQVSAFVGERAEITYLSSTISKDETLVTVRTRLGSADRPPLRVNYQLQRLGDTWMVYDIVIEGASLVLTYRNSLVWDIERFGIDGMIERIRSEAPGAYQELHASGRSVTERN